MQSLSDHRPQERPGEPRGDARKVLEDVFNYLGIIRRGWRVIVLSVLVAATAGVLHPLQLKPVYRATARLLVIQHGSRPVQVAGGDPFAGFQDPRESLSTQLLIIRSPVVVEDAVASRGLSGLSVGGVIGGLSSRAIDLTYTGSTSDEASCSTASCGRSSATATATGSTATATGAMAMSTVRRRGGNGKATDERTLPGPESAPSGEQNGHHEG